LPFNGSGTFVRLENWTNDATNNLPISATKFDIEDNDFASGLSLCLTRDGQGAPTVPLLWTQPLTVNRATDGPGFTVGRTGGANNPALSLNVADATGGTLNLSTATQTLGLAIAGTTIMGISATAASVINGTAAAPALSFAAELGSGLFRVGAGELGLSILGVKVLDFQASSITAFNSAIAGLASIALTNTSTTATQDILLSITAGSSVLQHQVANQNRASALVTGGPTTAQAGIWTTTAIPIVFGINGIYSGQINTGGGWQIPAPVSGIALQVNGIAASVAKFIGSSTSGSSTGIQVLSGTTNADYCCAFQNQAGSQEYMYLQGDGQSYIYTPPAFLDRSGTSLYQIGYLDIPQNLQNAAYQLALTDRGKHIYSSTGLTTLTIPANSGTAFPVGTAITFVNLGTSATIAITTDTLRWLPSGTTGNRTLAQFGQCTLLKVAATSWTITGVGIS
jgi:hypothetical protein